MPTMPTKSQVAYFHDFLLGMVMGQDHAHHHAHHAQIDLRNLFGGQTNAVGRTAVQFERETFANLG